jgi:hypothetical protein
MTHYTPAQNAQRLIKLAERLDNAAREVSYRAGMPVARKELARHFGRLKTTTWDLADALGYKL